LQAISNALLQISVDSTLNCDTTHKADSLLTSIQNFKFITSVIIWYDVLFKINVLRKMLQNPGTNIKTSLDYLANLVNYFKNYRNDNNFEEILTKAAEEALKLDVEATFPPIQNTRRRMQPKLFDYEHADEPVVDSKQNFKINF
jgi:hypothetical protein